MISLAPTDWTSNSLARTVGLAVPASLSAIGTLIQNAMNLVEGLYLPDLLLIASFYPGWAQIGGGLGNFMAYGDVPQRGIDDPSQFRFPQGVV